MSLIIMLSMNGLRHILWATLGASEPVAHNRMTNANAQVVAPKEIASASQLALFLLI